MEGSPESGLRTPQLLIKLGQFLELKQSRNFLNQL